MRTKITLEFLYCQKLGLSLICLWLGIFSLVVAACGDFTATPGAASLAQPTTSPTLTAVPGLATITAGPTQPAVTLTSIPARSVSTKTTAVTNTPTTTPPITAAPAQVSKTPNTFLTPSQAIEEIKRQVSDVDPVLVPDKVLAGYVVSKLEAGLASFDIEYSDPATFKKIQLAVIIPNPPYPGDKATQKNPPFRGVKAFYQVDDGTQPTSHRILLWNEPGKWNTLGQGQGASYVPYMLSSEGLTDTEFWQFANSLVKITTTSMLPASNPMEDVNAAVGSLKSYYVALNNEDYKAAYNLVVRSNRGADDFNKFIVEQKSLAHLVSLAGLKEQPAPPPQGSYVYEATLKLESQQVEGNFSPGNNERFVELVKDGGIWRIAQISSSPVTSDLPASTPTPKPTAPAVGAARAGYQYHPVNNQAEYNP